MKEYLAWAQEPANGLRVIKEVNGAVLDAQYRPDKSVEESQKDLSAIVQRHIVLRIGMRSGEDLLRVGATTQAAVQKNLYYYSYLFQNDIYIEDGSKKQPCTLFHFENSVGKGSERTFHLIFETSSSDQENFSLVVDSDRLSSLPIRFKIRNKDIPQVSQL